MKSNPFLTLAIVALFSLNVSRALAVDTFWDGGDFGDWDDSSNWSNGVPNNGVDNFNAFVPSGYLVVSAPVEIDNLTLSPTGFSSASVEISDSDFTVLQNTILNVGPNTFPSVRAFASTAATTVDLGALPGFVGNTLQDLNLGLFDQNGFGATIKWEGAQIQTIGERGSLSLLGANSSILNSLDNSNALAGLQTNEGAIVLRGRDFSTSGNFSNTGTLRLESFPTNVKFSVNGSLAQNSAGVLTDGYLSVGGGLGNSALIEWEGAEIQTIATGAGLELSGANSGIQNKLDNSDALSGLHTNEGSFTIGERIFTTSGNFSNSGYLSVYSYGTASAFSVNGTLTQNALGVLSEGYLDVSSDGGPALIEWEGAEIHTIAANAGVNLRGADSSIRNSTDNSDALAGLNTNDGSFNVGERSFTTAGNFSNTGFLDVSSFNTESLISINGTLAQNTAGVLTEGSISARSDNSGKATIAWQGADIQTIAEFAAVSLYGEESHIKNNLDDSDALAGLSANAGSLSLQRRDLTTSGNFTNSGQLLLGDAALATAGDFLLASTSLLTLEISGDFFYGIINAGGVATLDGDLALRLVLESDGQPDIDPLASFTVITGDEILGNFANIASGERLFVEGGDYSFLYTVNSQSVILSDFAAVPEPHVIGTLAIAGLLLLRRRSSRHCPSQG